MKKRFALVFVFVFVFLVVSVNADPIASMVLLFKEVGTDNFLSATLNVRERFSLNFNDQTFEADSVYIETENQPDASGEFPNYLVMRNVNVMTEVWSSRIINGKRYTLWPVPLTDNELRFNDPRGIYWIISMTKYSTGIMDFSVFAEKSDDWIFTIINAFPGQGCDALEIKGEKLICQRTMMHSRNVVQVKDGRVSGTLTFKNAENPSVNFGFLMDPWQISDGEGGLGGRLTINPGQQGQPSTVELWGADWQKDSSGNSMPVPALRRSAVFNSVEGELVVLDVLGNKIFITADRMGILMRAEQGVIVDIGATLVRTTIFYGDKPSSNEKLLCVYKQPWVIELPKSP
ncbi:MAG: hypothetical protein Q8N68_03560 [bacterium]|nr:hypothetical protein [bacterium]